MVISLSLKVVFIGQETDAQLQMEIKQQPAEVQLMILREWAISAITPDLPKANHYGYIQGPNDGFTFLSSEKRKRGLTLVRNVAATNPDCFIACLDALFCFLHITPQNLAQTILYHESDYFRPRSITPIKRRNYVTHICLDCREKGE